MKKQILLPVLAVLFAITGAYASNRLAVTYYAANDFTCTTALPGVIPCEPGEDEICQDAQDNTFRYKDTVEEIECDQLLRDVNR